MSTSPASIPPKPISEIWRPDLVALPNLTPGRRFFRWLMLGLARLICRTLLRVRYSGLDHVPRHGPALLITNHLGDADAPLLLSACRSAPEALGKVELHDFPGLGLLLRAYGVIWLHRGRPDRRALAAGSKALEEGRLLLVAPEGRFSLTGALEPGQGGAAWLALRSGAAIVPIAVSGSQNQRVYSFLRRLRRAPVALHAGEPFRLEPGLGRHADIAKGTARIMRALAELLPPDHRGVY